MIHFFKALNRRTGVIEWSWTYHSKSGFFSRFAPYAEQFQAQQYCNMLNERARARAQEPPSNPGTYIFKGTAKERIAIDCDAVRVYDRNGDLCKFIPL